MESDRDRVLDGEEFVAVLWPGMGIGALPPFSLFAPVGLAVFAGFLALFFLGGALVDAAVD